MVFSTKKQNKIHIRETKFLNIILFVQKKDSPCPCTYPGCEHHGKCCDCIEHHRIKGQLPACYFSPEEERTYDRSIECYNKNHS
ncbi:MAG: hypothetical protein NTX91_04240 [candidate division SR1 bacterium]|nr:hypothetical protein [candidate division SR1 bacterium]